MFHQTEHGRSSESQPSGFVRSPPGESCRTLPRRGRDYRMKPNKRLAAGISVALVAAGITVLAPRVPRALIRHSQELGFQVQPVASGLAPPCLQAHPRCRSRARPRSPVLGVIREVLLARLVWLATSRWRNQVVQRLARRTSPSRTRSRLVRVPRVRLRVAKQLPACSLRTRVRRALPPRATSPSMPSQLLAMTAATDATLASLTRVLAQHRAGHSSR